MRTVKPLRLRVEREVVAIKPGGRIVYGPDWVLLDGEGGHIASFDTWGDAYDFASRAIDRREWFYLRRVGQ